MRLRLTDTRYADLLSDLRASYDSVAEARDTRSRADWKHLERDVFLDRLRAAGAQTLLEVGAGPGHDSVFFQSEGLTVTAVDLSPEMVARARAKGIDAHVRDLMNLGFPDAEFDALYSINTLLHVPNADLDDALRALSAVLKPGGLFYLGVYGGTHEQGFAVEDGQAPARFFAFRSDQELLTYAAAHFEILDFHTHQSDGLRFQAVTLVRPLD